MLNNINNVDLDVNLETPINVELSNLTNPDISNHDLSKHLSESEINKHFYKHIYPDIKHLITDVNSIDIKLITNIYETIKNKKVSKIKDEYNKLRKIYEKEIKGQLASVIETYEKNKVENENMHKLNDNYLKKITELESNDNKILSHLDIIFDNLNSVFDIFNDIVNANNNISGVNQSKHIDNINNIILEQLEMLKKYNNPATSVLVLSIQLLNMNMHKYIKQTLIKLTYSDPDKDLLILRMSNELIDKDKIISHHSLEISNKVKIIENLTVQLYSSNSQITIKEVELSDKDAMIVDYEKVIDHNRNEIIKLNNIIKDIREFDDGSLHVKTSCFPFC